MDDSSSNFIIDINSLEIALKNAPYLCEFIGYDKIMKRAETNPCFIHKIFSENKYKLYQLYLEDIFRTITRHINNINYRRKDSKINQLLNPKDSSDILSEFEITANLIPYFKITPDYKIIAPKDLDLLIEYDDVKALIEIRTIHYNLSNGGTDFEGGRTKSTVTNKINKKFKDMKDIDLGMPFIQLFNIDGIRYASSLKNNMGILNAILGRQSLSIVTNTLTNTSEVEGLVRDEKGVINKDSIDLESIDFITDIGFYQLAYNDHYYLDGIFFPVKGAKYKFSPEFWQIFTNAFFKDN